MNQTVLKQDQAISVSLRSVSAFYGEVVGLSRVDLELSPGITGLVGPNGSGKSTLMKVMTGLLPPDEGEVRVLGGDPFHCELTRRRLGFVPALECFHPALSGMGNLEVAYLAQGWTRPQARELAGRALEVAGLAPHGHRVYRTWSRGMRQRLKLGLTLAGDNDVILLDEPFLGVDPPSRKHLRRLISELGEAGRTVLVSSHVLHEVESLTDLVGVLAQGRLLGFGKIQDLLHELRDRHPHRVRLQVSDSRPLAGALLARDHVKEVRILGPEGVEFVTGKPDLAYRELAAIVADTGIMIRRVETLDNGLEAVFRHVTAAGSRRL
jgi:ABC-2 type transport system ATP-binding protein